MVLPWVPATARQRRVAAMAARISARRTTCRPRRGRLGQLGVVRAHRRGEGHQVGRPHLLGAVADVDRHPVGHQPVDHRRAPQVAAGHRVAHGGEHGGDGAHPGPAHPHHVDRPRGGEVGRGGGGPRPLSGHGRPPPRPPGRRRRGGRRPGRPPPWQPAGRGRQQLVEELLEAGGVAVGVGEQDPSPGAGQGAGVGRLVVAGRPGERHQHRGHAGHGQLGHGDGPGPADHHVGRLVEQVHSGLEGDQPQAEAAGGVAAAVARSTPSRAGRSRGRCCGRRARPSARPVPSPPG